MSLTFENFRTVKLEYTFTGAANYGANGVELDNGYGDDIFINEDEYIYEAFYRITSPLTSGDTAGTYLILGIQVDESESIFGATSGILDTLNGGTLDGVKVTPKFGKSTIDGRLLYGAVSGTDDITGGSMEITVVIARNNVELKNEDASQAISDDTVLEVS